MDTHERTGRGRVNTVSPSMNGEETREIERTGFHFGYILLPMLFLIGVIVILAMSSGTSAAEHDALVEVTDHWSDDRVIEWNSPDQAVDVYVYNEGPDEISFVEFVAPPNVLITGWTTTNGQSTYWTDWPDVDGAPGPSTGGSVGTAAPNIEFASRWDNNITAGNWELFTIHLDTTSAQRGIYEIRVITTDNSSDVMEYTLHIAIIGMSDHLDICVDLRDHTGAPVEI